MNALVLDLPHDTMWKRAKRDHYIKSLLFLCYILIFFECMQTLNLQWSIGNLIRILTEENPTKEDVDADADFCKILLDSIDKHNIWRVLVEVYRTSTNKVSTYMIMEMEIIFIKRCVNNFQKRNLPK